MACTVGQVHACMSGLLLSFRYLSAPPTPPLDPPPAPDCSCFLQSQFTVTLDSLLALVKDMAGAGGDGVLVKDNNIAVGKTTL